MECVTDVLHFAPVDGCTMFLWTVNKTTTTQYRNPKNTIKISYETLWRLEISL